MPNCRSISPTAWEHARKALVFYFSRRHGISDAEDLAQDTLAALWSRADYEFEKEEDFLRVCYGFAARILQSGYRKGRKRATEAIDPAAPEPAGTAFNLNPTEIGLMLEDVIRIGTTRMEGKEWDAICAAAERDGPGTGGNTARDQNTFRVRVHRARQKLAQLTGWKRSSK